MKKIENRMPVLVETNPVWLWLYEHGWEDPEWVGKPATQMILAATILELTEKIQDTEVRAHITEGIAKMAHTTMKNINVR